MAGHPGEPRSDRDTTQRPLGVTPRAAPAWRDGGAALLDLARRVALAGIGLAVAVLSWLPTVDLLDREPGVLLRPLQDHVEALERAR